MFGRSWPYLLPALLPVAAVAVFPSLIEGAVGWLLLCCLAAAGGAAVAWLNEGRLRQGLARAGEDLERASRKEFSAWIKAEEWGPLAELAPSFNWLLQEVQGALRGLEGRHAEETAQLQALVHAIPDGIVLANLRGEVSYINAPAARMLGLPPEELARKGDLQQLVRQDRLRGTISRILARRARQDVVDLAVEDRERPRTLTSSVQLVSLPGDVDVGILILLRDVTVERDLERMKGDFLQAVAHDLRTPLLGIQGYLRMLEKSHPGDAREKDYYRSITQSCGRIHGLIQDVLDLSRIEAGTATLELSTVGPNQLVKRVHGIFMSLASEKGVELLLDLPALEPPPLQVDERLVERSLVNLVQNAVKFTPRGGRISLGLRVEEGEYVFSVEDTGPGIPPDQLQVVFEKFRQLPGPESKSGYGLGLTIAKEAVEAHGGRIWADSPSGRGCRFLFAIPRSRAVESGLPAGLDPRD